jgi:hypothetical protein
VARDSGDSSSDLDFPVFASFRDFSGKSLTWTKPKALRRHHELRDPDHLYATLRWLKAFGSLAQSDSSEGSFTIKRGGFLKPFVSVKDAVFGSDVATLNMNLFSGGTLEFSDGIRYSFSSSRFWGFEWGFKDEHGADLFSLRLRSGFKNSGDVVVSPTARRDRHLMVAIAAGWYAMVLANEEAAVAST